MNVEDYRTNKKVVKKLRLKKKVARFINKIMIVLIIFLVALIVSKKDISLKNKVIKYVYEDNIAFTKLKSIYDKYFGKILSIDKIVPKEEEVFSEKLNYKSDSVYKDGVVFNVSNNYMVPTIEAGIVVFMGEKEGYGNTVIVEQVDGVDTWYSNVKTNNLKMYDYIEKGKLLGEVNGDKLYMVFQKEGKYLNYKEYL